MKKYFLHNGTESSGPYDIEELRNQKITKNTPIWIEGMPNWSTAETIDDLQELFIAIPPPINQNPKNKKRKSESKKFFGIPLQTLVLTTGLVIVLVGINFFLEYQDQRKKSIEAKNHQTDVENRQIELKQQQAEKQELLAIEQRKIDSIKAIRAQKETKLDSVANLQNLISDFTLKIETAKEELKKATEYKFLRSDTQKREEVNSLQIDINSYEREIEKLERSIEQLQLELEKTTNFEY